MLASPNAIIIKVSSEAGPAKFRRKGFASFNSCYDFFLCCATFRQSFPCMYVKFYHIWHLPKCRNCCNGKGLQYGVYCFIVTPHNLKNQENIEEAQVTPTVETALKKEKLGH